MAKERSINMVKSHVIYKDYSKDAERTALLSGENLAHAFGKIARWYTDISWVGHTHDYAGSSTAGGAATSANKLNIGSADIGSETRPVYFNATTGKPVACAYSLNASVPANAVFTDTTYTFTTTGVNNGQLKVTPAGGTASTYTIYTHPSGTAKTQGLYKFAVDDYGHVTNASAVTGSDLPSHSHTLSMATDTGTSAISLAANTKYKLTAGGSTYIFTTPADTNTTYTFATGDNNGQIKVTPSGGTAQNVSVKGLGSAAYTDSSAYATSGHNHTLSMATDSGTSAITLAASTKYKLTAGGSTYIFTTPPNSNTTYTIATGDSNGQIKVTPSSGSAYNVSVKGLGSAAYTASTAYVASSGATTTTQLHINPAADSSNFSEGIRISKATDGWSIITLGCSRSETTGVQSGQWLIGVRGHTGSVSGAVGDLTIEHNGSNGTGLTLYANGNTPRWNNVEFSMSGHTHSYLPLSGGTMTGAINLVANKYGVSDTALNCNNSNITGVNRIFFADLADSSQEGISFYRSSNTYDNFWIKNGVIYFTPNRTNDDTSDPTTYTVYHSGNLTYSTIGAAAANHTHNYIATSNATTTSHLQINPSGYGDYDEGLRIGKDSNGWSEINLGCANDAVRGRQVGQWLVAARGAAGGTAGAIGDFTIEHNGSSGTGLTLYANGNTPRWNNKEFSMNGHTHTLSIAADSGASSIALTPNTKYKLTAGGSTYIFTTPAQYSHPAYTSRSSGLYKITVDGTGHVSAVTSVEASDLPSHVHNYIDDRLGANRFAFAKTAGITVEQTKNGGSSWSTQTLSDSSIFGDSGDLRIGNYTDSEYATANFKTRITINTANALIYTHISAFLIDISTQGSNGCSVTISYSADGSTWKSWLAKSGIAGWSGTNFFQVPVKSCGDGKEAKYVRFLFEITGGDTSGNYRGLRIWRIAAYGGEGWTAPSTMAKTGHLYACDNNQNASFPGKITTSNFIDCYMGTTAGPRVTASTSSVSVGIHVGSGGVNRGLYDFTPSVNDWICYSNGQSIYFNGNASSANKWKTARTLTIGSTGKSVDGSGNVSWSLAEIGAAAASHTHNYIATSGITAVSQLQINPTGASFNEGLRIGKAVNGWSNVNLGCANDATSSSVAGQWIIGVRGSAGSVTGAAGDFIIEHYTSTGAGLTLYANGNTPRWNNKEFSMSGHTHDYAPSSHNHAAGNITSGTLANARLPVRLQEYQTTGLSSLDCTINGFYYSGNDSSSPFKSLHTSNLDYMILAQGYSTQWGSQIAVDFRSNNMALRVKNENAWTSWSMLLTSSNYTSYIPAKLGAKTANGYCGMCDNSGADNVWIRTTSLGIIPYQSGAAGSGHQTIGTSSWYFSAAYIDAVYGSLSGNATTSSIPAGFSSRSSGASWAAGGTYVTAWNAGDGCEIAFMKNYPASGQLSCCIDGYFFQNEGKKRVLDESNFSSYITPSSIGAATSSHSHSYIPLSGSTAVTGEISTSSANGFRLYGSGVGVIFRKDTDNLYILLTDKKTDGSEKTGNNWNTLRPLYIACDTGLVKMSNGLSVYGGGLTVTTTASFTSTSSFSSTATFTAVTPAIRVKGSTTASVSYGSSNPAIRFENSDGSQNIELVFNDYDSVRAPASLSVHGNQGGEYLLAPNIAAWDYTNNKYMAMLSAWSLGTTSAVGQGRVIAGNGTKKGTAGNARGYIEIYSEQDGCVFLVSPATITTAQSGYVVTLPSTAGSMTDIVYKSTGDYIASSGATTTGPIQINPGTSTGSYNEGLRIGKSASNNWSNIVLGCPTNSTSQTADGQWLIGARGAAGSKSGAVGDLTIEHNGSSGTGLTLYKNGSTPRWNNVEFMLRSNIYTILWSGSTSCTARSSTDITLTTAITANKYRFIKIVWTVSGGTGVSEIRADTLNVINNVSSASSATTANIIQFTISSDGKKLTVGPGTTAITVLQIAGVYPL